jgi:hypothetical protein
MTRASCSQRLAGRLAVAIALALLAALALPSAFADQKSKPTARKPPRSGKPAEKPLPLPGITVTAFPGGATVTRGKKRLPGVKPGMVLEAGDVLKNAGQGNLDLRIGDQAVLRMKPNTTLRLSDLLKKVKQGEDTQDTLLRLDAGTILIRLRALKGQSRFIVDTPSATTAARGTAFLVEVDGQRTTVMVEEGRVAVALLKDPAKTLEVGGQQKVSLTDTLPAMPEPLTDEDKARLQELRDQALPVDAETEVLIRQLDGLLAAKKYAEAERLARHVVNRAWGQRNAVRAHARLLESLRQRTGSARGLPDQSNGMLTTLIAWGARSAPEGLTRQAWPARMTFVDQSFRDDPVARRWGLWGMTWMLGPGLEDTLAWLRLLEAAAGSDPVVREQCRFIAACRIFGQAPDPPLRPPGVRPTPEMLSQAEGWFEEIASDPQADQVDRIDAIEHLISRSASSSSRKKERRKNLELILSLAAPRTDAWGHFWSTFACAELNQPAQAEKSLQAMLADPDMRSPNGLYKPPAHAAAGHLAHYFQRARDAASERHWWQFVLDNASTAPNNWAVTEARQRLQVLSR